MDRICIERGQITERSQQRMNKDEYLNQVSEQLKHTDKATREEILDDFRQHFLNGEAQGKSDAEIIASLGDPSQFEGLESFESAPQEQSIGLTQRNVIVDAAFASVMVRHSSDNRHHVRLIKDGQAMESSYQLEKTETENELRVKIHTHERLFRIHDRDLDLEVDVAEGCETLRISCASGDIDVQDLKLDVLSIASASGDQQIKNVKTRVMKLTSASGDIDVHDVEGKISIETASGDATLDNHSEGSLEFHSASGDLRYEGLATDVALHTASGDGELTLRALRQLNVDTVSGDFEIDFDGSFMGAQLRFSAMSGEVKYDLLGQRGRLDGKGSRITVGDGSIQIALNSISGDFSLKN